MTENSKWKPVGGIAEAARSPSQPINKLFSENEAILNYIINRDKKSRSSPDAAIIGRLKDCHYCKSIKPYFKAWSILLKFSQVTLPKDASIPVGCVMNSLTDLVSSDWIGLVNAINTNVFVWLILGEKSIKDVMKHLGLLSHKLQYLVIHKIF